MNRTQTKLRALVASIALISVTAVAPAALIDFESSGQFAGNFRKLNGNASAMQTGPSSANDLVNIAPGGSSPTGGAWIYDTTPGDATATTTPSFAAPLKVSVDVAFSKANESLGIYLFSPSTENASAAYLALLNIDADSSNREEFRFFSGANPTSLGTGAAVGSASFQPTSVSAGDRLSTLTLTYSINGSNNPVLALSFGGSTVTQTFTGITAPLTDAAIGLRVSPMSNIGIDNFTAVPEPATLASIAGLAMLGLQRRRSKRSHRA